MAATVTEIGTSAVSANPVTSIAVTTTAAVNVGEILFFIPSTLSAAAAAPTASSTTAGGTAMTQDGTSSRGTGTTATNIWLFRYEPATTLASGSTVTTTITNGGPGSVGKCIKVAGLATGVGLDATVATGSGFSQLPATGATGTPPAGDEIFALAVMCVNFTATGGTTAGNSYTALTDLAQTTRAIVLYSAWKDLAAPVAAQNESWTPTTWAASKNWSSVAALYRVSGGAAPATVSNLSLLGVG